MTKLSLIEKINVVLALSKESKLYIILLLTFVFLGLGLSMTSRRNKIRNMIIYAIVAISIAIYAFASYHAPLGNMFSYMMNNFFIVIYFPTLAIYFAGMIATNIILWISIFNMKSSRQIRTLNITIYIIMNYLMFLLLNVINTNKLDVFNQEAVYNNANARSLIELSSIIFIIWVIFLIIYKIILIYVRKDYKPKVKKIIIRKKVKKLPNNFEPKTIPNIVYGNVPHRETIVIKEVEKEVPKKEDLSTQFTLEEYKLVSKYLKEAKNKENTKESNEDLLEWILTPKLEEKSREEQKQEIIRMEEERRELLRKEKEKQETKIQQEKRKVVPEKKATRREEEEDFSKLTELERLYRSIQ